MFSELPKNIDQEALAKQMEENIGRMHEAAMKQLDEMDKKEAYYEKRRLPLPDKLYHVTTKQNAQQILREGLDPSKLYLEDREVVSLSDDIDYAIGVVRITQKTHPYSLAVLEIDTRHLSPSRVHNFLRKADPDNPNPLDAAAIHEVHYESVISPDALKIVKHQNKK